MTNDEGRMLQIQKFEPAKPPALLPLEMAWYRDNPQEISLVLDGQRIEGIREVTISLTTYGGATISIRKLTTPVGGIQEDYYLRLTNPNVEIKAMGVNDGSIK